MEREQGSINTLITHRGSTACSTVILLVKRKAATVEGMPSGPFIQFLASKIPHILLRYLVQKFAMTSKLAWFYIQIMQCPCVCSLSGWWRYQVNMLIMRSIDLMCQTGSIDEIMEYDMRIPREFHLSKWLPHTQHTFAEWKDKKCPVVSQLLMDGIIAERSNETGDTNTERRTRRFTEPITGITMTLTGHGSEIFGGYSDLYKWTENPNQNGVGGEQRVDVDEEEGVYV